MAEKISTSSKITSTISSAGVSEADASLMAAGLRPVTVAALNEAATAPAWKTIPSWFVHGNKDKNIPPQALAFMAERAHSKQTVVVKGASHVVMVSPPRGCCRSNREGSSVIRPSCHKPLKSAEEGWIGYRSE